MSTVSLETLVKAYVSAEAEYARWGAKGEFNAKRKPEAPIAFNSLEEAMKFRAMKDDYEAEMEAIRNKRQECLKQQATLGKEILNLLPVANAWIRVGDYAVGFHYDTWGGGHYEIRVEAWSDHLPDLSDHTDYP